MNNRTKYGLELIEVGQSQTYDTLTERDKDLLRRSAHNQNERTERRYMTRSKGKTLTITRLQ
jgi:hypothetical protein